MSRLIREFGQSLIASVTILACGCQADEPTVSAPAAAVQPSAAGISGLPVKGLTNESIGEDSATIVIRGDQTGQNEKVLTEVEKTELLLATVAALKDAVFIRNGNDHTPEEAAAHLRRKLGSDSQSQASARAFVDRLATRSSVSGEPYMIRNSDGTVVLAGEFLSEKLKEIEAGTH